MSEHTNDQSTVFADLAAETIGAAIDDSIARNRIVWLNAYPAQYADLTADLLGRCDGNVDAGPHEEFWGRRKGIDWRIHVRCEG
jgi:hypothetical protein